MTACAGVERARPSIIDPGMEVSLVSMVPTYSTYVLTVKIVGTVRLFIPVGGRCQEQKTQPQIPNTNQNLLHTFTLF